MFLQVFPYLIPILLPFAQITLTNSAYIIVAIAIERGITVYK